MSKAEAVIDAVALPDFIGVGAQRAATSWMYQCLMRHPEVFMPRKEIHFFNRQWERGASWYAEHFERAPDTAIACGEFTPNYLADRTAINRIAKLCPDAKLIVILREPIARAFSAYNLYVSHGRFDGVTFEQAMTRDSNLVKDGLYGEHLTHLFEHFPRDQVKVFFHEDVEQQPERVLHDLYEWIGVDSMFRPDSLSRKYNLSGYSALQKRFGAPKLQMGLARSGLGKLYAALSQSTFADWLRARIAARQMRKGRSYTHSADLRGLFHDDIEKLQVLLGRDLSHWLNSIPT